MASPSLLDPALSILPARYRVHAVKITVGFMIICVVVLVAARLISNAGEKQTKQINEHYWNMSVAIEESETGKALENFNQILAQGNETQVNLASMLMAHGYFKDKDYAEAQVLYSRVVEKAGPASLRDTARIRLAKVLLALKRHEEASTTINEIESSTLIFQMLAESVLGDIYLLQQDFDEAGYSYFKAQELATQFGDQNFSDALERKQGLLGSLRMQLGLPPEDLVRVPESTGFVAQ